MALDSIDSIVLYDLYEKWFAGRESVNLHALREKNSWTEDEFWKRIAHMEEDTLVRPYSVGGYYEMTPIGVTVAESSGIVPRDTVQQNQMTRMKILGEFAQVYEKEGPHGALDFGTLCQNVGLDSRIAHVNHQVLVELGWIETKGWGDCITRFGRDILKEWERRTSIAEQFEQIKIMSPQARGRALNTLFGNIVANEGWASETNVLAGYEEMDVIFHREREYYLVECKWEKDSIEASAIQIVIGKLENRAGIDGLMVSMSGFTAGAVSRAEDHISKRVILLFGPEDVEAIIRGQETFEALLTQKYNDIVSRRKFLGSNRNERSPSWHLGRV